MLSDRISIRMRMHCCTVHTPCYVIKHLKESLSYIDVTPFYGTAHILILNVFKRQSCFCDIFSHLLREMIEGSPE